MEKGTGPVPEETALADRVGLAHAGTLVTGGSGTGLVVATGGTTELGRISRLLHGVTSLETPLTMALGKLGRWITVGVLAVTAAILIVGTARSLGQGIALGAALKDMLVFAVALAVGAIPEGLPAIVTIALAIGVRRMARRGAIIRKLPAVETLGSTTVICSDKTGTLTRNEMTVTALWTPEGVIDVEGTGYAPEGRLLSNGAAVTASDGVRALMSASLLCSDATVRQEGGRPVVTGDPTEAALVVGAAKAGLDPEPLRAGSPRLDVIPFESENQFMATLVRREDGSRWLFAKGATEVVLARCVARAGGAPLDADAVAARMEELAARGLRVLAVAGRAWGEANDRLDGPAQVAGLELHGLVAMIDPPRPEAIAAVAACRDAGIQVKMITGDHLGTARAVGAALGLVSPGDRAMTGNELAALDEPGLRAAAREVRVFARVAPEQKLALVRALQADGQVLAMTGDGVNDAPALRQADIGIAMGITGTSVAREAADMVLVDDNFATLVGAVEEGRRVYDNLVKSLAFILPTNLALALLFFVAVLFFPFDASTATLLLPVRPTQLLWVNLVAAVALALPLAFESMEKDVMRRPPRPPGEPIVSPFVAWRTVVVAVLITAGTVGLFLFEWRRELGAGVPGAVALAAAQTKAVTALISFQIFYLVQSRSLHGTLREIGFFSNPVVIPGIGVVLALHMLSVYAPFMHTLFGSHPLTLVELAGSAAIGATILPVVAIEKWLERRKRL